MATQKQRRRRAKEKRHAYDLVEIDAEGNETVLSASELKDEAPAKQTANAKGDSRDAVNAKRGRGAPQPPTWGRVLKRGAIFAPIFLATVMLLAGNRLSFAGAVVQTLFLLAIFIPFSYFMDRLVWRSQEKRLAKAKSGGR
jgi:hypothetical protein